jgi:purine-cytosine permease-like protein
MVSIPGYQFPHLVLLRDTSLALVAQAHILHRREAIYILLIGYTLDIIPLVLNGAVGAHLHVNFAVASRSSFGFYLSRVAVVIRMITALFWHGMSGRSLPPQFLSMSALSSSSAYSPLKPSKHTLDRLP